MSSRNGAAREVCPEAMPRPGARANEFTDEFRKFSAGQTSSTGSAPATSASTASPYRPSLRGPIPAMATSSAARLGRRSASAVRVASVKTTYAGTFCAAGRPRAATRAAARTAPRPWWTDRSGSGPACGPRRRAGSRRRPGRRRPGCAAGSGRRAGRAPRRRPLGRRRSGRAAAGTGDGRRARPPGERAAAYDSQSHCRARVMPT